MFKDNRLKVFGAMERAFRHTLDEVAELASRDAADKAPKDTGTLARTISTKANQGSNINLTEVRYMPEAGRWIGQRVPTGKVVHVPRNDVKVEGTGWFIEWGAYAPYSAAVEMGTAYRQIVPRRDRTTNADGSPRTNPHLRFSAGGTTQFRKGVWHYAKPHPFVRPAWEHVKPQIPHLVMFNLHREMKHAHLLESEAGH